MKFIDRLLNKTKDGFVKENVVIARVGAMDYLGSELGMGLNPNEFYAVHVTPDELFKKETIESIEGVDATYIHPDKLEITLNDWRGLTVGHVQNIYQDGDFLKGTIFIKDKDTIATVEQDGIKEVSLGYDSDIIEKDGKLIKTNIRANHLAIVPEGRCGSACKIGDSKKGTQTMFKKKTKLSLADSIALSFGGKTSGQKAVARKFGDMRKKLNDAKVKLGDSARQKLADLEAVMTNPDATDEQKAAAVEAVATVSDDIAKAIEILDGADTSVTEAEKAVEEIPVNDAALPEGVTLEGLEDGVKQYIAELESERDGAVTQAEDLQGQLDEAKAEIESLKAELESLKGAGETATAVADAKARFPKIKIGDSVKSARDVQAQVLIAKGVYNDAQVKTLTDCAIGSAYQTLVVRDSKAAPTFGKKLVDEKGQPKNRASQLGGKKVMGYNFNNWDSDARGTLFAGQIRRGSQSTSKAWAEENLTAVDLAVGTFVTINADGGVKAVSAATDIIHGLILADIYGQTTPNDKILNIAHCNHGDEFVAVAVDRQTFARGDAINIVATGVDAGKITKDAGIATAYIATYVSGQLVAFTRREVPAPVAEVAAVAPVAAG